MSTQNNHNPDEGRAVEIRGELTRRLSWAPLRALSIVTGFVLVRNLLALAARFCLGFRNNATLAVRDSSLALKVEWSILGRKVRQTTTIAPIREIQALRIENRQGYLYLLVGFGSLAVGTWLGIQWFVDGLRAGYPYLALVGAGIVATGVLMDLGLYTLAPRGSGQSRLVIATGRWKLRLARVDGDAAQRFLDAVHRQWNEKSAERR
jgi:hypothetical protein